MTTTRAKSGKIRLKAAPESVPPHPASLELASSEMAPHQAVLLKAATIKDVAREAGVAPMTVSYAFTRHAGSWCAEPWWSAKAQLLL